MWARLILYIRISIWYANAHALNVHTINCLPEKWEFDILMTYQVDNGESGCVVVKHLACGTRGTGFETGYIYRHFDFRDCLSPALESQDDWNNVKTT